MSRQPRAPFGPVQVQRVPLTPIQPLVIVVSRPYIMQRTSVSMKQTSKETYKGECPMPKLPTTPSQPPKAAKAFIHHSAHLGSDTLVTLGDSVSAY